jgi:hypothetical protein
MINFIVCAMVTCLILGPFWSLSGKMLEARRLRRDMWAAHLREIEARLQAGSEPPPLEDKDGYVTWYGESSSCYIWEAGRHEVPRV